MLFIFTATVFVARRWKMHSWYRTSCQLSYYAGERSLLKWLNSLWYKTTNSGCQPSGILPDCTEFIGVVRKTETGLSEEAYTLSGKSKIGVEATSVD